MRRAVARGPLLVAALALGLGGGCGYTLSSVMPSHIKTVAIPVFANSTVEFGLADEITQSLTDAFLADRRLRIVREHDADSVLRGTVISYRNQVFGYTSAERATEYEVVIGVKVSFRDMVKSRELWKEDALTVRTTYSVVPVGSEPAKTESEGRREAIQKLTEQILSRTLQGW